MRRALSTLAMACALCANARADFYVVVHAANPQASMTKKDAVDLFMGRKRAFADGQFAAVYDLPRDHPTREGFYRAMTGLSLAQVNSYWSRLVFAGESQPPRTVVDDDAMLATVRKNPNALGWISREPGDKLVRVVLVLKETR